MIRFLRCAVLLLALATLVAADDVGRGGNTLTGSWRIRVTIPAGSSACPAGGAPCVFLALSTVSSDGTLIQTAALPATSTGHGVWTRTGNRHFQTKTTYFRLDPSGFPIGTAETVSEIDVSADGQIAQGSYTNTILALDGQIVGSFSAAVVGTRILP